MADTNVDIIIKAKDQFSEVMEQAKGKMEDVAQKFKQVGATFSAIGAVGVLAVRDFVKSAEEENVQMNQLNAVLKSTHGAAGLTSDAVRNIAEELQKVTPVGKEATLAGQNMLLSFTKIGKEVFPKATETLLDMATAMNNGMTPSAEQLSSQAIQLGKALNDPTVGLTALTRVGVSFTEQQKKQIQTMQKHGNIAGAQKLILAELATEFGGRAKEAANTFSGQMEILNNRAGDLKQNLGQAMIPILQKLGDVLGKVVTWFENLGPSTQAMIGKAILLGAAFFAISGPILLLIGFVPTIIAGFTAIATVAGVMWAAVTGPVALVIAAIALVGLAVYELVTHWNEAKEKVSAILDAIKNYFSAVWDEITRILEIAWQAIEVIFIVALTGILSIFGVHIGTVKTYWVEGWNFIKDYLKIAVGVISSGVSSMWNAIATFFTTYAKPIQDAWESLWGGVSDTLSKVWDGIKNTIKDGINWVIDKINYFIQKANEIVGKAGTVIGLKIPDLGSIPKLAEGGIVTRPTIAMIGEAGPEAVVPLSRGGGYGGINVNITVNGDVTGEDIMEKIGDKLVNIIKMHTAAV